MTAITRFRGDTNPDTGFAAIGGVAIDITGCSFILTVDPEKAPADATNNLFALTGVIVDAPTGEVKFPITDLQANQTPGTYYYDIQMIDSGGEKRTIALDKYTFKQDITK
jgi:hypothetical protein